MKYFFIVMVVAATLLGGTAWWFSSIVNRPASGSNQAVTVNIAPGEGVKAVADKLYDADLISARWHWNLFILMTGRRSQILSGEYKLRRDQSIREIANIVTTEPEIEEVDITFIEGWTATAMADVLERAGVIKKDEFLSAVQAAEVKTLLPNRNYPWLTDKPATASLEGYLFPDTYSFFVPSTVPQVLGKMLDNFDKKYSIAMRQAVADSGRTNFETIILASIVERELKTDRDRAMAADLFLRRLDIGMALQSDATVNYVTGKSALRPTNEDLAVDSLYNTYKYPGLPPGPISNPGLSALRAAAKPEANDYYYFISDKKGVTHFAKTLAEHNANIAAYLE